MTNIASNYSNGTGNVPRLPDRVVDTLIDSAGVSRCAPGRTDITVRDQTAEVEQLVHDTCEELLARLPDTSLVQPASKVRNAVPKRMQAYAATLQKIATVNAMDHEYQRWARDVLGEKSVTIISDTSVTLPDQIPAEPGPYGDGIYSYTAGQMMKAMQELASTQRKLIDANAQIAAMLLGQQADPEAWKHTLPEGGEFSSGKQYQIIDEEDDAVKELELHGGELTALYPVAGIFKVGKDQK